MYAPAPQPTIAFSPVPVHARHESRRGTGLATMLALAAIAAILALVIMPSLPSSLVGGAGVGIAFAAPRRTPPADADAWYLTLVNDTHPIEPCQPELTQLRNNQAVDARCYPDLQRMFDAARAVGLRPLINSSYRSREDQQRILDSAIAEGRANGLSDGEARRQALRTVAEPGTSEHELGLAIDVTSEQRTALTDTAVHTWLATHGWEYGWILRYPAGKEELTGIDNEPWHFRYVGPEAAAELHESGLCLEEYLGV